MNSREKTNVFFGFFFYSFALFFYFNWTKVAEIPPSSYSTSQTIVRNGVRSSTKDVSERTSEYRLGSTNLAHWSPGRTEIVTTLLIHEVHKEAQQGNNTSRLEAHRFFKSQEFTCSFCYNNNEACIKGEAYSAFATDEGKGTRQINDGGHVYKQKLSKSIIRFNKDVVDDNKYFKTMLLSCRFNKVVHEANTHKGKLILRIKDRKIGLNVQKIPPTPKKYTAPVVCGRLLLNYKDVKHVKNFVLSNVKQGFATTIMYDLGSVFWFNDEADVLAGLIADGSLVIVNLFSSFTHLYEEDATHIWFYTKAFMQMFLKAECVYRVRPVNPAWILFTDIDEFPVSNVDKSIRVVDVFDKYTRNDVEPAVMALKMANPEDNFCSIEFDPDTYYDFAKNHPILKNEWYNTKYAIRPFVGANRLQVHTPLHYIDVDYPYKYLLSGELKSHYKANTLLDKNKFFFEIDRGEVYIRNNRCTNRPFDEPVKWWRQDVTPGANFVNKKHLCKISKQNLNNKDICK